MEEIQQVRGFNTCVEASISDALTKFWELEEIVQPRILSVEDQFDEDLLNKNITRNADGCLVLRLPFSQREISSSLDNSRKIACARLFRSIKTESETRSSIKLTLTSCKNMSNWDT